ncbi:uncharacterized protein N7479_009973 [Penicillium vulpinum]|uniref:uncharacterized protein n=1 Tax=Penicillium vulpinum TaxID=29845 RepID=UPI0025470AB7|nr:uncharacterized protein N7479_009973 [Penicillium vulpinum]KAJ5951560.1 hypothetical protein N7479_009973 [Penicillium vulpinum]
MQSRKDKLVCNQMEEEGCDRMPVEMTYTGTVSFMRDITARITTIGNFLPSTPHKERGAIAEKEPYDVILSIAIWNAPFHLASRAVTIPLAAGNTVVVKGPELLYKCIWAIDDLCPKLGCYTKVGATIVSIAGKYVKPVLLELGRQAPIVVLDDADLEAAACNCVL